MTADVRTTAIAVTDVNAGSKTYKSAFGEIFECAPAKYLQTATLARLDANNLG